MNKIEQTKEILAQKADAVGFTLPNLNPVLNGSLKSMLLAVITNDFQRLMAEGIISTSFLKENFSEIELLLAGVFIEGDHLVNAKKVYCCGNASVKAIYCDTFECYDSSTFECSTANGKVYNTAQVKLGFDSVVWAFNSSQVQIVGSQCVVFQNDSNVKLQVQHDTIISQNF